MNILGYVPWQSVSTHNPPLGHTERIMQYIQKFHMRTARQYNELAYMLIIRGEVCGRDGDDTHLIRVSINAPPSVVVFHSKLPRSVIILVNGQLFSLGSRVCTLIVNPAVLASHKLSLLFLSCILLMQPHVKSYKPRSSCKT
jgi:hypothetical protein